MGTHEHDSDGPAFDLEAYQTHWHPDEISEEVPGGPDSFFAFYAWDRLVRISAGEGRPGRVIDVACGDARDIRAMAAAGWDGIGYDSSSLQLLDAKRMAEEEGQHIHLVRGVAEFMPFKPGVFNSLICKSALDHFVDRHAGMREFSRVLDGEGRAVVSANNYGGATVRASRLLY
ncbi:MAG: methyltransferase domain-containing protein, partial [Dehalococcoidia bacterium]